MSVRNITRRRVLVVGATGKQGGATIKQLLALPNQPFSIVAVTRSAAGASAQKLKQNPLIEVVEGDLAQPAAIFKAAGGPGKIWGVFMAVVPGKNETAHGNGLIDSAVENGVQHFVYSSVERHGDKPTSVPHFIAKHETEKHLKSKNQGKGMGWTILQPVAFFENITNDLFGGVFGTIFKQRLGSSNTSLQFIATSDIGFFAAKSFDHPEEYNHKTISLAGDCLTFEQANDIMKNTVGTALPTTYGMFGWLIGVMVKDLNYMFKFFKDEGYSVDIPALRSEYPALKDFKTWLQTESQFKK